MPRKYTRVDLFYFPSTNEKIEKFINHIMKNGKKNVARQIFENTLEEIKQSGHANPQLVRETAIENASPNIMVKSRRIG